MTTIPRDGLRLVETIRVLLFTAVGATAAAELTVRAAQFAAGVDPAVSAIPPGAAARGACLAALGASVAWWFLSHVTERPGPPFLAVASWAGVLSLLVTLSQPAFVPAPTAEIAIAVALHVLVLAIVVPPWLRLGRD